MGAFSCESWTQGYFCIRIWKIAFTDFGISLRKNSSRMMTMGMERMWQG